MEFERSQNIRARYFVKKSWLNVLAPNDFRIVGPTVTKSISDQHPFKYNSIIIVCTSFGQYCYDHDCTCATTLDNVINH